MHFKKTLKVTPSNLMISLFHRPIKYPINFKNKDCKRLNRSWYPVLRSARNKKITLTESQVTLTNVPPSRLRYTVEASVLVQCCAGIVRDSTMLRSWYEFDKGPSSKMQEDTSLPVNFMKRKSSDSDIEFSSKMQEDFFLPAALKYPNLKYTDGINKKSTGCCL